MKTPLFSLLLSATFLLGWTSLSAKTPATPPVESVVTIKGIDYPVFNMAELKPLKRVQPEYPFVEGERGMSGKALVLVLVDRAGNPAEVMLKLSEPSPVFGEEALKAVKKWRFQPAQWKGQPTEYIMQVPMVFRVKR